MAVVLCGGGARRFGSDKTRADLGGRPLLDVLLDSLPLEWSVVCVGEERATGREVTWTREDPPGGGPVAGLAAALPHATGDPVVVLGGDMPFAGPAAEALALALAADPAVRVAAVRDGDGRVQPLLAAYRLEALRSVLPTDPVGARLTPLLTSLEPLLLDDPGASLDVDTPADLERARHRVEP